MSPSALPATDTLAPHNPHTPQNGADPVAEWCALLEPVGRARTPALAAGGILINQADEALYRAKRGGRNRVCLATGAA